MPQSDFIIENVHVFTGDSFSELRNLHISNGQVTATGQPGCRQVDGQGGYLTPGLIDAHVHLTDDSQLNAFREYGITTVLDMACWPAEKVDSYRNRAGLPDIRSAGVAATSSGSSHSKMPDWPLEELLDRPEQAERWVERRVSEGSDYIKVICDAPGPPPSVLKAVETAARKHGKMIVAHAATLQSFRLALEYDFDFLTHLPTDSPLTEQDAEKMKSKEMVSTPTLVMLQAHNKTQGRDFDSFLHSFKVLKKAGVPILASTDANSGPGPMPKHGSSLLEEMELMHSLGMTALEVLQSATQLPAKHFGLNDRGTIDNGKRADLVLLDSNPLQDLSAFRRIQRVWCNGLESKT